MTLNTPLSPRRASAVQAAALAAIPDTGAAPGTPGAASLGYAPTIKTEAQIPAGLSLFRAV